MFSLLIAGVIVWLLIVRQLTAKSWESHGRFSDVAEINLPPARVGLWVFLAVVTSLFGLFITAYSMRMRHGSDGIHYALPRILWVNTLMLMIGSLAFETARRALHNGQLRVLKFRMVAAGLFTCAFLAGQLVAWQQFSVSCRASGQLLASSPAAAFFILITAVHGLHLLGGLWVWGRTTARLAGGAEIIDVHQSVELCAVYWHYLLLLWIVLFTVLSN